MLNEVQNRKLKLALLASLIVAVEVFVSEYFGLEISVEEMMATVTPLLSFIGMEGLADVAQRYQQYKNKQ